MRKLIMWNVISLDGCFEGSKPWDLSFHDIVWGSELENFGNEQLSSADLLVFGKNTYEGMADYWSKAKGKTAEQMNAIRKVVCSSTLKDASWNNTTIVREISEISKLKKEGNGNMFVFGSSILSESLMKENLFDEIRLVIAPVILGNGRRLFNEAPYQKLKLLESRTLQTGGVIVTYVLDKS